MSIHIHDYEIVFLLSPSLSESEVEVYFKEFEQKLKKQGSENISQDYWGKKTLAYPIKKENTAHYGVINFSSLGSMLLSLDEDIRLDNTVLRHLITKRQKVTTTQSERQTWNAENLPEKKKKAAPEEKRAPQRTQRNIVSEAKKEEKSPVSRKKLDEILDI